VPGQPPRLVCCLQPHLPAPPLLQLLAQGHLPAQCSIMRQPSPLGSGATQRRLLLGGQAGCRRLQGCCQLLQHLQKNERGAIQVGLRTAGWNVWAIIAAASSGDACQLLQHLQGTQRGDHWLLLTCRLLAWMGHCPLAVSSDTHTASHKH
jgi:hypothetical protein